ncbi:unnamed protein product [Larinioides sclopetarius]|uniref:Uncharacterized protein n=1 Tax=Larinioides sclopetarius TaxID=280406 RepID=A0AAV2A7A1_9ARAC
MVSSAGSWLSIQSSEWRQIKCTLLSNLFLLFVGSLNNLQKGGWCLASQLLEEYAIPRLCSDSILCWRPISDSPCPGKGIRSL